jgi:hypothetical protein
MAGVKWKQKKYDIISSWGRLKVLGCLLFLKKR